MSCPEHAALKKKICHLLKKYTQKISSINEHVPTIFYLALMTNPKDILEVGCGDGSGSTLALAAAAALCGSRLYTIDICFPTNAKRRMEQEFAFGVPWTVIQGDSVQIGRVWKKEFDLFFLDSSHLREKTIAELELFMPHLRTGGLAIFHDTMMNHGVGEPLQLYLRAHPEYSFYNYTHCGGLGVVRKGAKLPLSILEMFEKKSSSST